MFLIIQILIYLIFNLNGYFIADLQNFYFMLIIVVISGLRVHLTSIFKIFLFFFPSWPYSCLNINWAIKSVYQPWLWELLFITLINSGCVSRNRSTDALVVNESSIKISKFFFIILTLIILKIVRFSHILIVIIGQIRSSATTFKPVELPVSFEYHYENVEWCNTDKTDCECTRCKNTFLYLISFLILQSLITHFQ